MGNQYVYLREDWVLLINTMFYQNNTEGGRSWKQNTTMWDFNSSNICWMNETM